MNPVEIKKVDCWKGIVPGVGKRKREIEWTVMWGSYDKESGEQLTGGAERFRNRKDAEAFFLKTMKRGYKKGRCEL